MGNKNKTKRAQKRRARAQAAKSMRRLFAAVVMLIVGVSVWAGVTGANKAERGDLRNGQPCGETTECAAGHLCYSYQSAPYVCMQKCGTTRTCPEGYRCRSVARMMRSGVRPELMCVPDAKL